MFLLEKSVCACMSVCVCACICVCKRKGEKAGEGMGKCADLCCCKQVLFQFLQSDAKSDARSQNTHKAKVDHIPHI